jgi:hypothetical protein
MLQKTVHAVYGIFVKKCKLNQSGYNRTSTAAPPRGLREMTSSPS